MVEPVVVTDRPGRHLTIRLALEQVVVTESRYGAGQRGPRPHVHRLHTDCFYVIDGALTLSLADGDRVFGPGSFVLVPPNVVHSFRIDGPLETRFLNMHAPGMAFDRYVQGIGGTGDAFQVERAARYDQYPPPKDGGLDPATVIVRTAGTDAVDIAGVEIGFLADADETLGGIGLIECTAPPSFPGPPLHIHERTWDAYYVLEGRLAVHLGNEQFELEPGDVAAVPPGIAHGFSNALDAPTRFLDVYAPGGFEHYLREVAVTTVGDVPPVPAVMAQIASRYDVKPV